MDLRKKKKKKSAYTTLRAELLYPPSPANPATHTHLLEQLKLKTPTPPNAGKDVEQQELSLTAGTVTMEDSLAVSYKMKHTLTV